MLQVGCTYSVRINKKNVLKAFLIKCENLDISLFVYYFNSNYFNSLSAPIFDTAITNECQYFNECYIFICESGNLFYLFNLNDKNIHLNGLYFIEDKCISEGKGEYYYSKNLYDFEFFNSKILLLETK